MTLTIRLVLALSLALSATLIAANIDAQDPDARDEIGLTTAQLAQLRGFVAQDHHITTTDGYVLNLVRLLNPKINAGQSGLANKSVVLFLHGTLTTSKCFLINSIGAKPQDYSSQNAGAATEDQLDFMLAADPSVNSLPLLLSNFGHEVWLLDRRGSPQSMARVKKKNATLEQVLNAEEQIGEILNQTIDQIASLEDDPTGAYTHFVNAYAEIAQMVTTTQNSDYWNFSLDEQAKYDFPEAIKYILKRTARKKLSIVGHSAGGAITLMALATQPNLANKVGQAVLWAPSVNMGHGAIERFKYRLPPYVMTNYEGPVPPLFATRHIQDTLANLCSASSVNHAVCRLLMQATYGMDGPNQNMLPGFVYAFKTPTSSFELAQLAQTVNFGKVMHFFDYGSASKNQQAYGSSKPPEYDFSKITLRTLTLYAGISDGIVSSGDVKSLRKSLTVPSTFKILSGSDGYFNHIGFLVNDNAGTVANIPSLIKLEQSS